MYTSSIDISIRTLDSTGTPVSTPKLYGVVSNIRGEQQTVLTLEQLTESEIGVYTLEDFDVSDAVKYPGTEIVIFWCTNTVGISPEVAVQRYAIFAKHPAGVRTRLLMWQPSYRRGNLYGYRVYRKLRTEEAATRLADTVHPYFFDRTAYDSPTDFHLAEFTVCELIWAAPADDEPIEGLGLPLQQWIESRHEYCEVYGELLDVIGGASAESVNFFVHEKDAPQTLGSAFLMRRRSVTAPVNYRGEFSIPLLQGALVTVEMPEARTYSKFVVPKKPRVALKDITTYPLEITRAD